VPPRPACFATFFLGVLYVQQVLHYAARKIGFAFLPVSVLMGILSVRYPERLSIDFGARRLCATGLSLIALALAVFVTAPTADGYCLFEFL
jgi:hypothetical protein